MLAISEHRPLWSAVQLFARSQCRREGPFRPETFLSGFFSRNEAIPNPNFPFLRLPLLPQEKILKMCDKSAIIQLALCSKRMEQFVKAMRISASVFGTLAGNAFGIVVCTPNSENHLFINFKEERAREPVDGALLAARCIFVNGEQVDPLKMSCEAGSSMENTMALFSWLLDLFATVHRGWHLNINVFGNDRIGRLVEQPLFPKSDVIFVDGEPVEAANVSLLLNAVPTAIHFRVESLILQHFQHHKPFRYPHTAYRDANWVSLDDLLSINLESLSLGRTNFNSGHMNVFLKKWLESDVEMVRSLKVILNDTVDLEDVLDGIVTLKFYDNNKEAPFMLISPKRHVNRVGQFGTIGRRTDWEFSLTTVPEDRFPGKKDVFRLLHQKADLQTERDVVREEMEKCDAVEAGWDSEEWRRQLDIIRELKSKEAGIQKKLADVEQQLKMRRVDLSTGRAVMRE